VISAVVYGYPMDTTTKAASAIFGDQLTALEALFGIELTGSTLGERIVSLRAIAKADPKLTGSLLEFFNNPIHFASKFVSGDDGIFAAVVKTLFAAAVRGAIHEYGSMGAPKKQHWMPLAYLGPFGTMTSESKNSRSVSIPGVSFADELVMGFETRDTSFIHEKVNGAGFYEDGAEFFFCMIESLYAQGRTRQDREIDHGLVALFFFVQSVRNPRYGQRFVHSKLSDILDAILVNMDAVGPKMQARFLKAQHMLPFTPYVPPFVDRFGSARVYSLPVSPKMLFVLSTEELSEVSWRQTVKRYRDTVILQAQRRGSFIFGVSKDSIMGTLDKLNREG